MKTDELTEQIIGAAIEVHRHKGPGLLESTYELCLQHELTLRGIQSERQLMLPIEYKGLIVPEAYRIDLLVENKVIVELKTVTALQDIHTAQVLTYLQASEKQVGLLINFHTTLLKDGIRRIVHNYKVLTSLSKLKTQKTLRSATSLRLTHPPLKNLSKKTPRSSATSAPLRLNPSNLSQLLSKNSAFLSDLRASAVKSIQPFFLS